MKEALYYEKLPDKQVVCKLCPNLCRIHPGKKGICKVRKNEDGVLFSLNWGVVSSVALDPIEKKPLYNFMPGSYVFSIGSIGCNLSCEFCQNWQIATPTEEAVRYSQKNVSPDQIVDEALRLKEDGNIGIAYTYNEPTVWFEYMKDIALLAKENGLKNIMVSNGYIEPDPLSELLDLIDAFNIDLKSYSNLFYKNLTHSSLAPVLHTLERIALHGNHLEIAYLVIPGENDDPVAFAELVQWINEHLGKNISLHINRYFPCHKMKTDPTPVSTLQELYKVAKEVLPNVYMGNI